MRHLADLMGLRDWYLTMSETEPKDDSHGGECEVIYGQKCATISFREDWPTWGSERVRSLMVHELIHCHTEPAKWALNNIKFVVGDMAFSIISEGYNDAVEVAIDGIAREWARTLPLPVKPKRKKAA